MHRRRIAGRAALAALIVATTLIGTGAAGAAPPEDRGEAAYWTPARRAAAVPRDLVIDERGLGYLRRPDGSLEPYGHDVPAQANQLRAVPAASKPSAAPGGGTSDTTPPDIGARDPLAGGIVGTSHTFTAVVTDNVGVRSVTFVIVYPNGTQTQSFSASGSGDTWSVTLQGFTVGDWSWYVVATDTAKRGGNSTTSSTTSFTVSTGGGGGGGGGGTGDVVVNSPWSGAGAVQTAAGRIYFEMPTNWKHTRWAGYVCSGTTITDGTGGRSVILTAAHCVYDDANKAFARNVMFIPDQADSGTATDRNCTNDTYGCWMASFGVVDLDWTTRTFPNNVEWDYGYYVVNDVGAHAGAGGEVLDALASLSAQLDATAPAVLGDPTHALGYSYSDDPNFMYCAEGLAEKSAVNWWLGSCDLSGGSSGGPWMQPVDGGNGPIVSVNSWGYTTSPGMAGPKLAGSSASCLLTHAAGDALGTNVIAC